MTGFGNIREARDEYVLKIAELSEMRTLGFQHLSPFPQLLTKQPSEFFFGEIKKYRRKNIHKLTLGGGGGDGCLSREVQLSTSSTHSRNCQPISRMHAEFLGSFVVPLDYEQTLEESLQGERQRPKRMKKLIGNWNSADSGKKMSVELEL